MSANSTVNDLFGINEDVYDSSYEILAWDDLEIDPNLLRGIYAYGFEKPSPIQQKAIKPLILKKDIVAQAQSGTGKTATFTIGALANVDITDNSTQILVLSPTKELTTQTAKVFAGLGGMLDGLRIKTVYGGSAFEESSSFSNKTVPHVICGCPGRVYDMMRRDKINSRKIKLVILDEADEMLSSGFKDQVYNIFQNFSSTIQVALFSATMPDGINTIISKIMRNPVKISVKREALTLEGIKQYYVAIDDDHQKYATLKDLFSYLSISQCIIYCNSIKRVQDLYEAMKDDEFPVCRIHGNMDKTDRETAFNDFKTGGSRVLISSNVTARGIDIQQVSIVINFDLPKCVHTYLHRIGRSGRWGRKGVGINFITRRDVSKIKTIEEHYSTQISEMPSEFGFLSGI
uniref:RNA helicase n=1 Tax=viral metagenome TaxID=1070528 RepID=A0A6C0ASM0_9ZZZZ